MKVEVVGLKKHYGNTKAVDGISFEFASGQIFGFVGPNGAGKSTTMRILATLDEPTAGDCYINDISVSEEPEKIHRLIGYVPDNEPTHRDITVHDYLDFFARSYGIKSPKRQQVIESIEEFTNLLGIREKYLNALSKGMKNRVSLARALVHDPQILIMDEPAAGLDPRARIELRELLKALATQGKAILISSHILTELAEICTGTVIIERGRMLRAGTLQQILEQHSPHRSIVIRTTQRVEDLNQRLLELPHVVEAKRVDGALEIDFSGDEQACAELLAALVKEGFPIYEFHQQKADLEDIFMNVTKGEVQ